jgi:hypothetical protein
MMPHETWIDRRRFVKRAQPCRDERPRCQTTMARTGVILHVNDGQLIPPTPDGRTIMVKIDSHSTPGGRTPMITEDLPPNAEIRVHLHQAGGRLHLHSDGQWRRDAWRSPDPGHGRRHHLRSTKQRLLRPDRTQAEIEADRAKYGIVYRTP